MMRGPRHAQSVVRAARVLRRAAGATSPARVATAATGTTTARPTAPGAPRALDATRAHTGGRPPRRVRTLSREQRPALLPPRRARRSREEIDRRQEHDPFQ